LINERDWFMPVPFLFVFDVRECKERLIQALQ